MLAIIIYLPAQKLALEDKVVIRCYQYLFERLNILSSAIIESLAKQRILWLQGEVNEENMNDLAAKMLYLSAEDPKKDIYLYINSPGGSVTDGLALYDMMQTVPNDIVTVGLGMCASMGQFLLSSGTKGKRFGGKNLRVLMHQPSGGFGGQETDIVIQADLLLDMKRRLAQITADNTGHTLETILNDGERDHWYFSDEALAYGFIDHLIDEGKQPAVADLKKSIKKAEKEEKERFESIKAARLPVINAPKKEEEFHTEAEPTDYLKKIHANTNTLLPTVRR